MSDRRERARATEQERKGAKERERVCTRDALLRFIRSEHLDQRCVSLARALGFDVDVAQWKDATFATTLALHANPIAIVRIRT